jgi:class 3 adenylate cyclase
VGSTTACNRCGADNRESVDFCETCGAKIERECPACGVSLPVTAAFCGACGHSLAADVPQSQSSVFGSPDSYTPSHISKQILSARASLEGERKHVTVLFADIQGSTKLIQRMDPEQARKILAQPIQLMMDAVHRFEGTVNRVVGDGIMALFGAPLAHEDHAVRACYAALAMQDAARNFAEQSRREHGFEVQLRVGLNSGEVVVGTIGNDLSMDYDVVGMTAHLASRMEQLALPGTIRLTPDTLHLAEGFVEVKSLGPVPVKGLEEPIEVFDLTGASATQTRLLVSAGRGLTRFVGRDHEVATLYGALERAGAEHGELVAIVGEAGVGKSRLCYEFLRSHRLEGWLVLECSAVSYGETNSWLPVIGLLKRYFEVEEGDDKRRIAEKIGGKLLMLDAALKPAISPLLALFDVPAEEPEPTVLSQSERHRLTLDAIKGLFYRESQTQPIVLVFEDLHWVDRETQDFLDSLVESLPTCRILLLTNYRPEYKHEWGGRSYYTQTRIDPLGGENAADLVGSLLGDDPGLATLKQVLIERTEGNPLFLEESVRTLLETGVLSGKPGAYQLKQDVPTPDIPASVQAIISARIDRLSPEAKRLLQCAAVIGHRFSFAILEAVAETPADTLHPGLDVLKEAEFVYERQLFPDLEYTFKHTLTHEVTYGGILQERRNALHRLIGETIESQFADKPELSNSLHYHFTCAEAWDKLAQLHLRLAQ